MPSIVVTSVPAAALIVMTHDLIALPPCRTVHAPHRPTPQPYFAPIRPISSRKYHSSGICGSPPNDLSMPLTLSRIMLRLTSRHQTNVRFEACGRRRYPILQPGHRQRHHQIPPSHSHNFSIRRFARQGGTYRQSCAGAEAGPAQDRHEAPHETRRTEIAARVLCAAGADCRARVYRQNFGASYARGRDCRTDRRGRGLPRAAGPGGAQLARSHQAHGGDVRSAGHAYIYLLYGISWALNLVAASENEPHAVLIRALE